MKDFNYWENIHDSENLEEFNHDMIGQLWLKTKSIARKELITEFAHKNNITLSETSIKKEFIELFDILRKDSIKAHQILDEYIREKNKKILESIDSKKLVSELHPWVWTVSLE